MRSSLAHTMKGKRIHTTAINSPQMTQSMTVTPPTKSAAIVCAIIVVIVSFLSLSELTPGGCARPPRAWRGKQTSGASLDPKPLAFWGTAASRPRSPAAAIYRRWRTFPFDRTSDEIRISSQIPQSFFPGPPRLSARCVLSPFRKSCSASIRHASLLRFASLAFPYPSTGWLGPRQGEESH